MVSFKGENPQSVRIAGLFFIAIQTKNPVFLPKKSKNIKSYNVFVNFLFLNLET